MYSLPVDIETFKSPKLHSHAYGARTLLQYHRDELLPEEYDTLGKFRSIILSNQKIVCYSPPKSTTISLEDAKQEEIIDGTMINVFYDGEWMISTKTILGAQTRFYQDAPTFADMFQDACIHCNLFLNRLNPLHCYSFVLQHPDNRIVTPIDEPKLYLVEVYRIEDNVIHLCLDRHEFATTWVRYPETFFFSTEEDIQSYLLNEPYSKKGIMIKKGFQRGKYINPAYTHVETIHGNHHHLTFAFLQHLTTQEEWLLYYPEYTNDASKYQSRLTTYIDLLYVYYVECFIHKKKGLKEYDNLYKYHLYALHGLYLSKLKPRRMYKKYVVDYIYHLGHEHLHNILECANLDLNVLENGNAHSVSSL